MGECDPPPDAETVVHIQVDDEGSMYVRAHLKFLDTPARVGMVTAEIIRATGNTYAQLDGSFDPRVFIVLCLVALEEELSSLGGGTIYDFTDGPPE